MKDYIATVVKNERIAENITYRLQDIYVKDRDEAMSVDTSLLIQGSKLLIVEAMELYVLNQFSPSLLKKFR